MRNVEQLTPHVNSLQTNLHRSRNFSSFSDWRERSSISRFHDTASFSINSKMAMVVKYYKKNKRKNTCSKWSTCFYSTRTFCWERAMIGNWSILRKNSTSRTIFSRCYKTRKSTCLQNSALRFSLSIWCTKKRSSFCFLGASMTDCSLWSMTSISRKRMRSANWNLRFNQLSQVHPVAKFERQSKSNRSKMKLSSESISRTFGCQICRNMLRKLTLISLAAKLRLRLSSKNI